MILKEIIINKEDKKLSLDKCRVLKNGLENDLKAGKKHKEVSIYIERFPLSKEGLCSKRFKANLTFSFDEAVKIEANSILNIGSALLRVNPIKKKCFSECTIKKESCPLPENVFYCSVLKEGFISVSEKVLLK